MTETAVTTSGKEPIKASELDPKFKYELLKMHGSEKILKCFQCGTCTSDCPVARYSDSYRPRTLIHMAQLGLETACSKATHYGYVQPASHAQTDVHKTLKWQA